MGTIILSSLLFAILNILLFWSKNLALNFTIFSILFTFSIILVLKQSDKIKNKKAYILVLPIIILSLTYSIFNNRTLNLLNSIIIPILDVILAITLVGDKLNYKTTRKQIAYTVLETLSNMGASLDETKKYLKQKDKKENTLDAKEISSIVKAIFITLFVVFIIIGLLSSADNSFSRIFTTIFEKIFDLINKADLWTIIAKVVVFFFGFILLISFYLYLVRTLEANQFESSKENKPKDSLTIKMILLSLNLVYLLFVLVQINAIIHFSIENASVSAYAREGFFQLMLVSAINIITVLIAKNRWKENTKNSYIKINSVIMIIFTVILIILSFLRMNEYVKSFGLTFLRISVYFSLLAEIIVMIPTLIYILKGKLDLNIIYFTVCLCLYVIFNVINVNGIIGSFNVYKLSQTGKIDLNYIESIGEDATVSLIKCLDSGFLTVNQKHDVAITLSNLKSKYENGFDIREFSISKLISYNMLKNSNYEDYILKNKTLEEANIEQDTAIQNPYTSDSPIVEDDVLLAETYDFELGNKYTQEECNKIAKDYLQEIAKTSNVDWVKEYYSKFTIIYESKPVVGVHPNNYWECVRDGIGTADVSSKGKSWTEDAYEVTLVRYDDDVQLERALVYINPKTGKVIAGREMGD